MNRPLASKLWRAGISVLGVSAVALGLLVGSSPEAATAGTTTTSTSTSTTTSLPGSTTSTSSTTSTTTTTIYSKAPLAWPSSGSAAIYVPQLSVTASSPNQPRQPIASLTKLMTAWVVLHRLPLSASATGPCEVVDGTDMALYEYDEATDQSGVPIALGERLCERTLLRGMLVHSAGDYAQLLAALTGMSQAGFVNVMNQTAKSLGLRQTHYVDVTGISTGDMSTAANQVVVAADLMTQEPIVRGIVILPQVALPLAGVVQSYTPFTGQGNVIGVKSGYTDAAGGCDAMAVVDLIGTTSYTTFVVVLGEHSWNALGLAGSDALTLSHSIRTLIARVRTPAGLEVEWIGSPGDVATTTTTTTSSTTTTTTSTTTTTTIP